MTTQTKQEICIEPLKIGMVTIKVEGITPLLMNPLNEKAQQLLKQYWDGMKKPKEKTKVTPKEIAEAKIYYTPDGKIGFPSSGFKRGIETVMPQFDKYGKKDIKGGVFFLEEIVPIKFKIKKVNQGWGRSSGMNRTPMPTIRPEFTEWSCELKTRFNTEIINLEQLINLLNWAGTYCGLGDWRPEKRGTYGQYQVSNTKK